MPAKKINKVSIVMGSQSDFKTMKLCQKILKILKIKFETKIVSAHRTPNRMYEFAKNAEKNNISVIISQKKLGTFLKNRVIFCSKKEAGDFRCGFSQIH